MSVGIKYCFIYFNFLILKLIILNGLQFWKCCETICKQNTCMYVTYHNLSIQSFGDVLRFRRLVQSSFNSFCFACFPKSSPNYSLLLCHWTVPSSPVPCGKNDSWWEVMVAHTHNKEGCTKNHEIFLGYNNFYKNKEWLN